MTRTLKDCSTHSKIEFSTHLVNVLSHHYPDIDLNHLAKSLTSILSTDIQQEDNPLFGIKEMTFESWVVSTREIAKHLKASNVVNINGSKLLNIIATDIFKVDTTHILKAKLSKRVVITINPYESTIVHEPISTGLYNLYSHLECDQIEGIGLINNFALIVDENAKLYNHRQSSFLFELNGHTLEILGKAMIVLNNEDGDYENISEQEFLFFKNCISFSDPSLVTAKQCTECENLSILLNDKGRSICRVCHADLGVHY